VNAYCWKTCAVVSALLLLGSVCLAQNQPEEKSIVTGTGTVEVKRLPEALRVQVEVLAKGKDLKEALSNLKNRKKSAEQQLVKFGFTKEAVRFDEPMLSSDKTDRQRQMEMMVRDRIAKKGKDDPKNKPPPPVFVAAILKAEFSLPAAAAEELLLLSHDLQEKIKTADLAGMKDLKPASPQDEELAEEGRDPRTMGMDGEPQRGEPVFLFVSKIPDEVYAKALADAFAKAKRDAGQLARAAGAELDTLHNLQNASRATGAEMDDEMAYRMAIYRQRGYSGTFETGYDQEHVALGAQPGKATFRVTVTASFHLKNAPPK
jgi:uncharacterized protein YggE